MTPGIYVKINSDNGQMHLTRALDYDRGDRSIELMITVHDNSVSEPSLLVRKKFTLTVLNLNDHEPEFINLPGDKDSDLKCVLRLYENLSKSSPVYQFRAFDADQSDSEPPSSFSIRSVRTFDAKQDKYIRVDEHPFQINATTGWLELSGDLDRELIDNYILDVSVTDKVRNRLSVLFLYFLPLYSAQRSVAFNR